MRRADELEALLTAFEESIVPTQSDILAMNEWCLLHATFGDKKQAKRKGSIKHLFLLRVAEKYMLDNLRQAEEVLGENHSVTMMLLKNMVTFYQRSKKYAMPR